MPFSDVLYQRPAQDRLQRALQADRAPHAYLFAGPDGVGKQMLAARLAAVLLCSAPQEVPAPRGDDGGLPRWLDACGQCEDCVLFAAGNHPDFHRIYRALSRLHPDREIRKQRALEMSTKVIQHFLIDKVGLSPSRGRAKIFVIMEAHTLGGHAQNAMLKTLEEPPEHSYLVLLTDSVDLLLPTTRSRCQHVAFRRLPSSFVVEHLVTRLGATPDAARFLAELSQGSLGTAVRGWESGVFDHLPRLLEALKRAPDDALGCGKMLMEIADALAAGPAEEEEDEVEEEAELTEPGPAGGDETHIADDEASEAAETGEAGAAAGESSAATKARAARKMVFAMAATVLRDVLRTSVGSVPMSLPNHPTIPSLATGTNAESIGRAIRSLGLAEYQIDRSANVSLIFDSVGIALSRVPAPRG